MWTQSNGRDHIEGGGPDLVVFGVHQNNRFTMVVTLISHIRDQNNQIFQIEVLFYADINSYFVSCKVLWF